METEKKPQAKKEWTKPELIVLVRSKPEEAVLASCKWDANGPIRINQGCAGGTGCPFCTDTTPS